MNKRVRLMVGTPAYNGQMQVEYVGSLLDMIANGISYSLYTVTNDSLVARARNTILAQFHANKDFSHLFFLDADVGIRGQDVRTLIEHERDVIGAPVRKKVDDPEKPVFNVGKVISRTGTLASVARVGTAALILSRKAVDKLVEHAIEQERSYQSDSLTPGAAGTETHYDVFRQGVKDGIYVSEDYQACDDLRELGFEIFADLGIRTKHFGMYEFSD